MFVMELIEDWLDGAWKPGRKYMAAIQVAQGGSKLCIKPTLACLPLSVKNMETNIPGLFHLAPKETECRFLSKGADSCGDASNYVEQQLCGMCAAWTQRLRIATR